MFFHFIHFLALSSDIKQKDIIRQTYTLRYPCINPASQTEKENREKNDASHPLIRTSLLIAHSLSSRNLKIPPLPRKNI